MELKQEESYENNHLLKIELTPPISRGVSRIAPMLMPRNEENMMVVGAQEGRKSYLELQMENLELKNLLQQEVAEVERNQQRILKENELLLKENAELKRKLEEQRIVLKKSERERKLLQTKMNCIIQEGFQKVSRDFAEMTEAIYASCSDDMDVVDQTESMVALPPCTSHDLPTATLASDSIEGSNLTADEDAGIAEFFQVDHSEYPQSTQSESSLNLRRSQRSSVVNRRQNQYKEVVIHAKDTSRLNEDLYCVCGYKAFRERDLTYHINYFNSKDRGQFAFVCTVCSQRCFSTANLRKHMRGKHKVEYKETNGCRKCGQTFSTRKMFRAHAKSVHHSILGKKNTPPQED